MSDLVKKWLNSSALDSVKESHLYDILIKSENN